MIRSLIDRISRRRHSIQYEIQRMTHRGGWQNYYDTSLETPPAKPDNDDDIQIVGTEEGQFRCIRRKDGHIESVAWRYETNGADALYTHRRREAAQRERLAEMSLEKIRDEIRDRDELDSLSIDDLMDELLNRREQKASDEESRRDVEPLAEELIREVAARSGSRDALSEYRDLIG